MTLCGLQATHKPTLLLPQSCHHRQMSTGAAMVLKKINSNKGTAAHRDTCDTLWASGDAQTHTLTPGEFPSPADIHLCRNSLKKKAVTTVLLPIEIHVTFCGLQGTHKPTLLLPESSHHRQTSTGATKVIKITNGEISIH